MSRTLVDLKKTRRQGLLVLALAGALPLTFLLLGGRSSEGLIAQIQDGDVTSFSITLSFVVLLAIVIPVATVVTNSRDRRFHEEFRQFVTLGRRSSPLIIGYQPHDLLDRAGTAAVPTDRIGAGLVGFAIRSEGVEVWVPGDVEPRWRVRRTPGWVSVLPSKLPGKAGNLAAPVLHAIVVYDGERSASVIPSALKVRGVRQTPTAVYAQALRDLGEDPADHLVLPARPAAGLSEDRRP